MTLVINYLEIENFKSYYGKNTLGPFHQVRKPSQTLIYCGFLYLH